MGDVALKLEDDPREAAIAEKKERQNEIRLRTLDIKAELAEYKRVYLTTGESPPDGLRATLEAEMAALAAENFRLGMAVKAEKVVFPLEYAAVFTKILVGLVKTLGLGHLVKEAEAAAMAACGLEPKQTEENANG